jgi:hypothetical protein
VWFPARNVPDRRPPLVDLLDTPLHYVMPRRHRTPSGRILRRADVATPMARPCHDDLDLDRGAHGSAACPTGGRRPSASRQWRVALCVPPTCSCSPHDMTGCRDRAIMPPCSGRVQVRRCAPPLRAPSATWTRPARGSGLAPIVGSPERSTRHKSGTSRRDVPSALSPRRRPATLRARRRESPPPGRRRHQPSIWNSHGTRLEQ